jgi:predicted dehydrogenase
MRTGRRARIAVAGLGRIGRVHADNLATRVSSAELAWVVDQDEALARELGDLHGVAWSGSVDEPLADPALDGLVVAAPSALHAELVKAAAAAGRHVFCEKPLGLDADSCAEAVAACEAADVALQVGFQRRFDPDWQALKAALDAGEIGLLAVFLCSHRNPSPPPEGTRLGDAFADMATHDLDSARWLGGEVREVYAAQAGAAAVVTVRFESGAAGLIDLHRNAGYGFECRAELVGSRGTIRCGFHQRRNGAELLRESTLTAALPQDHAERHAAAYIAELEHFGGVATGQFEPAVTGRDALAALRLATLAARSAA